MMTARIFAAAALAVAFGVPATAGGSCIGFRCHDSFNDAWITHEKIYNKKLTKKQAYRICKNRYPIMSDIIVFRISKGWECRIRRP
jgi:hypothetical protein